MMEIPNIPRIISVLAECGSCFTMFLLLNDRKLSWEKCWQMLLITVVQTAYMVLTKDFPELLWLAIMAGVVVLMVLYLFLLLEGHYKVALFYGLQSFIIAELGATLGWQIYLYTIWKEDSSILTEYLFMIPFYILFFLIIARMFGKDAYYEDKPEVNWHEICIVLVLVISIFSISNIGLNEAFITSVLGALGYVDTNYMTRTITDVAGVAMLYAYHRQRCELWTKQELAAMQNVLQNQYVQYQQMKKSTDIIDIKYHDLKHQIAVLRAENDPKKKNYFLDQMEEEILLYEGQNKTGNTTVDTILTSKNIICEKNHITMNCVIDGALLDFMAVMDICSLLGNALDNAIECEMEIENPDKRLIHVAIRAQNQFAFLKFENYYEGNLEIVNGLPATHKKETDFHGYGLKSIRQIARKYGGEMKFSHVDGWFQLSILIPMKQGKNAVCE